MTARWEVMPARVWRASDGRTASLFGAVPYHSLTEQIVDGWEVITRGYTVRDNVNGTYGIGRAPFATIEEAQEWVDAAHARAARNRALLEEARARGDFDR